MSDEKRTNRGGRELSEQQWVALDALAQGLTITQAASAAGTSRQTVSKWRHHNAIFVAALNAAARDQLTRARAQMLALAPQVVVTLAADLERGDERGSRAARDLAGLLVRLAPDDMGPTTAEDVEDEWQVETMMALPSTRSAGRSQ